MVETAARGGSVPVLPQRCGAVNDLISVAGNRARVHDVEEDIISACGVENTEETWSGC